MRRPSSRRRATASGRAASSPIAWRSRTASRSARNPSSAPAAGVLRAARREHRALALAPTSASTCPSSTASPIATSTLSSTPAASASTSCSIFIASSTISGAPGTIRAPGRVRDRHDDARERRLDARLCGRRWGGSGGGIAGSLRSGAAARQALASFAVPRAGRRRASASPRQRLPSGDVRRAARTHARRAARGAQGGVRPGEGLRALPGARRDAQDGRVRLGQRRRRADVRRRGARRFARTSRGCRSSGAPGNCWRRCSGRSGCSETTCLSRTSQVPSARQPRSAADRDRQLPGVPAPPGRADPAGGDLHAGQLLDEAAARRSRPASRACTASPRCSTLGRRAVRLYPIFHPAAALYTPRMLETLREDFARLPSCSRSARPSSRPCSRRRRSATSDRRRGSDGAEPCSPRSREDPGEPPQRASSGPPRPQRAQRRGRSARAVLGARLDVCSMSGGRFISRFACKEGFFRDRRRFLPQGLKAASPAADTGHVSIPPGVTTGPRPFLPRAGRFNWAVRVGSRVSTWPCASSIPRTPRRRNRSGRSSLRACATATWCSCAASSARARRRSCAAPRARSA